MKQESIDHSNRPPFLNHQQTIDSFGYPSNQVSGYQPQQLTGFDKNQVTDYQPAQITGYDKSQITGYQDDHEGGYQPNQATDYLIAGQAAITVPMSFAKFLILHICKPDRRLSIFINFNCFSLGNDSVMLIEL